MILYAVFVLAVFIVVVLVILGGVSVWTHDEHPPLWSPPEHVKKLPPVYDQEDDEWLAQFLEEHRDP